MSPEVLCSQNHTIACDYFALGVIAYEFMNGRVNKILKINLLKIKINLLKLNQRPYVGKSRKEIKEQIMAKQVQIKLEDVPEDWSQDAADLINKVKNLKQKSKIFNFIIQLLQRKPGQRIGLRGAAEVKDHPWLKYYPWKELYQKKLEAPFIPKIGDNFDKRYCESADKIGETTKARYERYTRDQNFKEAFKNFTIINLNNEDDCNKEKKDNNNNCNNNGSNSKELYGSSNKRPMHMRSSSGISNSSNNMINNNNNFYSSLKLRGRSNVDKNGNGSNSSNNLNENILKSKVKIIDKEKRIPSSMNSTGMINTNLRNTAGHKQTQSYNSIYGNHPINSSQKKYENTPDKRSSMSLNEARNSAKPTNGRLPNINNIDKLKIRKLINSNNSNQLFKYYKSNSNVTNNTNGGLNNQIFNKKI